MPSLRSSRMRDASLFEGLEAVIPMKRESTISEEPEKRARRALDLSAFRYQPLQDMISSTESYDPKPGSGSFQTLASEWHTDSLHNDSTRSNSIPLSIRSRPSRSTSVSPLSGLPTVSTETDDVDRLLEAAKAENAEVLGDADPSRDGHLDEYHQCLPTAYRSQNSQWNAGASQTSRHDQFKLQSAFFARYCPGLGNKPEFESGPRSPSRRTRTNIAWPDLIRPVLEESQSGIMTHHEVWQAMKDRCSVKMLENNSMSNDWKKSVHSALHNNSSFRTVDRQPNKWKWALAQEHLASDTTEAEINTVTTGGLESTIVDTRDDNQQQLQEESNDETKIAQRPPTQSILPEVSDVGPPLPERDWQSLIVKVFKASPKTLITQAEIYQAIKVQMPPSHTNERVNDWRKYVRQALTEDKIFYKSRGTGNLKWGLNSRPSVDHTADINGNVPLVPPADGVVTIELKRQKPSWRTMILDVWEVSPDAMLTKEEVCRAIEVLYPAEYLTIRTKNWQPSVWTVLTKDRTFHKYKGKGYMKYGLESHYHPDRDAALRAQNPQPAHNDAGHQWADMGHGIEERGLYSPVNSIPSDPHVVEDENGQWRLRETANKKEPDRRKRQAARLAAHNIASMAVAARTLLTPREKAIIPMAMQWLMRAGSLDGKKVDNTTLFVQLTDASFLPELSRADALKTVIAATDLLQLTITNADVPIV